MMGMLDKKDRPLGAIIVARAGTPGNGPEGMPEEDGEDDESKLAEKAKLAATDAIFKAIETKDHKGFLEAFGELAELCDDDSEYEKKDDEGSDDGEKPEDGKPY